MKLINDSDEKAELLKFQNKLFQQNNHLPGQVFSIDFNYYLFSTFEDLFFIDIFNAVKAISNNESFYFSALGSEFSQEERIIVEFDKNDTIDNYTVFRRDPDGESSSISSHELYVFAEACMMFSKQKSWAIYAEREFDTAIIGLETKEMKEIVEKILKDRSLSYDNILEIISQSFGLNVEAIPKSFRDDFEASYLKNDKH